MFVFVVLAVFLHCFEQQESIRFTESFCESTDSVDSEFSPSLLQLLNKTDSRNWERNETQLFCYSCGSAKFNMKYPSLMADR